MITERNNSIMYIDFHVHAFADKIAQRAMDALMENSSSFDLHPTTDGTIGKLKEVLVSRNISKAVLLPIATKPSQQTTINNWAASVKDDFFCPFGTVHPLAEDWSQELERIKELGLYGIKFHPDYQNFFIDDDMMMPIYQKCSDLELPVLFHAGLDPLSPEVIHCLPESAAKIADMFPDLTMILAHGGGLMKWDDVEKYLAGRPGKLYFDVSVIAEYISSEQLLRIIKKHGADRILYGSDSPWSDPAAEIKMINDLALSEEEKEMIFCKNAEKLLNI